MKFASVSASSSGDNTIIAAVANKRIKVLHYTLGCDQNADILFKSASTAITGKLYFGASSSFGTGYGASSPSGFVPVFQTEPGEALVMNINGAKTISGHMTYIVGD